jgi:hypothetical protein
MKKCVFWDVTSCGSSAVTWALLWPLSAGNASVLDRRVFLLCHVSVWILPCPLRVSYRAVSLFLQCYISCLSDGMFSGVEDRASPQSLRG